METAADESHKSSRSNGFDASRSSCCTAASI
jgi:hypothetical protein